MKTKTLPMMELISVHSAFRALTTLLKSYSNINTENFYVFVNTQVMLSWLLTEKNQSKKPFHQEQVKGYSGNEGVVAQRI